MPKVHTLPAAEKVSINDKVLGVVDGAAALVPISDIDFKPASASEEEIKEAVLALHPIGSYYWSSVSTSPASLFGGVWDAITDGRMLYATTNTNTGGASTVSITENEMPSHTHSIASHTHSASSHYHSYGYHSHRASHTHTGSHNHTNVSIPSAVWRTLNWSNNNSVAQTCPTSRHTDVPAPIDYSSASASFSCSSGSSGNATLLSVSCTGSISSTTGSGLYSYSGDTSTTGNSSVSIPLSPPCIDAYCWVRRS